MPASPAPRVAPSQRSAAAPLKTVAELGERVRAKRRQLRATQAEVADLAGVGVRFLSELERGKESVEFGKVLRVLRALGLDLTVKGRGE